MTRAKPRGKAPKAAGGKVKVKIAVVRALAAALGHDETNDQIWALDHALAALSDDLRGPAAAAALGHTRKGTAVARAYLQAMVDAAAGATASDAATTFVRHCAEMPRGRAALRDPFVALWRLAADPRALDGAFANFSRALLDDPELLVAGVAAARALGDPAVLAEREATLALAGRLQPLLADLTGGAPARKRAAPRTAALSAEERRHVHRRIASDPTAVDEKQTVAAVLALVDDPTTPTLALVHAIHESRHHGSDEVVAAWKQRVAAGDTRLIARLIELFDQTTEWATDDDLLEPYIHALYAVGGRPDVFALVERALASPNAVVREAVFEEWLRETEGQRGFSDEQIDRLTRRAIEAANGDTDDRRAAGRALFYMAHAGARHAIVEGLLRTPKHDDDKLRWNLYFALEHIDHPDVLPVIIDRLFVEDHELWALMSVFEAKLDAELHRQVLARLEVRRDEPAAARAAGVYADVLTDKKPTPRFLIELGRRVAAWPAPGTPRAAQHVRYVLEQAAAAALLGRSTSAARTLLDRLDALPGPPRSDYYEDDRTTKTPRPLAAPEVAKLLKRLRSGALDREAEAAKATAAAARAAGKPVRADDALLSALTGGQVDQRLVTGAATREVWFFDDAGALMAYDGYDVAPAPCTEVVRGLTAFLHGGVKQLLAGRDRIAERATFATTGKSGHTREVLRLGDRVIVYSFTGNNWGDPLGLALADEPTAQHVFALLRDHPPDGQRRVDSWYVEGKGALRRDYWAPLPTGDWNDDGDASVVILGRTLEASVAAGVPPLASHRFETPDAAVAAVEGWEGRLHAEHGGQLKALKVDASATRREDTVLAAFFEERYRTDDRDAAWHLRGLAEIWQAVVDAGLADQVPDIAVALGPPATDAEIAAYQALVPEPLPASVVELWKQVGGGGFSTASRAIRFLSPAEIVARRDQLRDAHRTWIETRLKGYLRGARREALDRLEVVALADDAPLIVFDTHQLHGNGECFAAADSSWESELGWQIATTIAVELKSELERRIGDVFRLHLGQRPGPATRRTRLEKADKFWEAIVDGPQLLTRFGRASGAGKPSLKQLATAEDAAAAFAKAVAAAKAKGFRPPRARG